MAHYDPRKHPQWWAVRQAIKGELVAERDGDGRPVEVVAGWMVPTTHDMAAAMLNGLADIAVEAAFALDKVVHK